MVKLRAIGLVLAALTLESSRANAGALEDGIAAAKAGNSASAVELWAPLARQGSADEQFRIAQIYFEGPYSEVPNTPMNDTEAAKWFLLAARQGLQEAQLYVGAMYNDGRGGLPRDRVRAFMWLSLSGEDAVRDMVATRMTERRSKAAKKWLNDAGHQTSRTATD